MQGEGTVSGIDWATAELPDAWPDRIAGNWRRLATVFRAMVGKRVQRVQLPEAMPGRGVLPKYLFQEFHHLPNGNYSKTITRGYARSFDRAMLGTLTTARAEIARRLAGGTTVLDVGCGAGQLTQALQSAGLRAVWAIDPSPYLLPHAARDFPGARYVQGVIEASGRPAAQFDGAGACFVFHEIPPRQADAALDELHRLLRPGARLVLVEPSATQLRLGTRELWRRFGWRGLYFRAMARRTHEPFVPAWHKKDVAAWFAAHGFTLVEDCDRMPWRLLEARRD
jgi:ubiquinone/menaquinone biosynthesis C-methylase UbiE